ncbi:MAG: class I mannose-6-phosphate isomerase [Phycisphaeraceae bacterium]|nr:class I mannose-6-phosphate isomerase [Phycisphaerales bacterium]MCB9859018.1 class I mannose-6-phosphate isomerase [Phycisphaeraceae bacterium]
MPPNVPFAQPILLDPLLIDKVWGGDRLTRFGKNVKPGAKVGESWELADLDSTSTSGAGGGAAHSRIASPEIPNAKTLRDLIGLDPNAILGDAAQPKHPQFPLLVKFLDAAENLSVQVHPSPTYAESHEEAHLKTECWYILDAAPGSVIYKGVKPGVDSVQFEKAITDGTVVDLMHAEPAIVGHMHNLPSGTVHALGAGVVVAEVQTPSDTTFRVFDWGRTGRELHIAQAMQCIDFDLAPVATQWDSPLSDNGLRKTLVQTEFFIVEEMRLERNYSCTGAPNAHASGIRPVVIMQLRGSSVVTGTDRSTEPLHLVTGSTTVVPASASRDCVITGMSDDCVCLVTTVIG